MSEKPNVKWDDVAGLEGAKEALKEVRELSPQHYYHNAMCLSNYLSISLCRLSYCPPSSRSYSLVEPSCRCSCTYCRLVDLLTHLWLCREAKAVEGNPSVRTAWDRSSVHDDDDNDDE